MRKRITFLPSNIKQALTSKVFLIPFTTVLFFFLLFSAVFKNLPRIESRISSIRKRVYTQLCANLAVGIPQKEITSEQKSEFGEKEVSLPKCGENLTVVDAETGGMVHPNSTNVRVEALGFSSTDCDRAEITLRLVKENQLVWENKQIDSSCSVSEEGRPGGNYIISLAKPAELPDLLGTELEICFDLVNKSGGRASQNKASDCPLLASVPYLCQTIPISADWR